MADNSAQEFFFPKPPEPRGYGPARAIAGGLTFNNADELEAYLRSQLNEEDYTSARDMIRKQNEQYAKDYPVESTALELAGGIAPMAFTGGASAPITAAKGAGTLARLAASPTARAMATGLTTGVASGMGAAKELSDVPAEMANYGILGTAFGAATPLVNRTAIGTMNTIKDYFAPNAERKTAQLLERAVRGTGLTPQQIMEKLVEDRRAGVMTSSLADSSDDLRALAQKLAGRGRAGSRELQKDAENTLNQQPGRIQQRVKGDLRSGDYYADEAKTIANLRAEAPQWYEDAYSFGDVQHPDIAKVLNHPDFANAFRTAKGIAETEALGAELRGEDVSKYKLKELYQTVTNDKGELTGFKLVDVPDVRTLDYLKRGIQANIDSAYSSQNGMSKTKAAALKEVLEPFLATIDRVTIDPKTGVSKYAQTRKKYGDEKEITNAFSAGKENFKNMDHEEIAQYYNGLSDAAKTAARTGVARDIYDKINKAAQGSSSVAKVVSGDFNEAKLAPLFESPEKFDLFKAAMKREVELHDHAKDIIGATKKGAKERAESNLTENAGAVGGALIQAGSGNWLGGAKSLSHNVATAIANPGLNDEVAAELSKRLLSKEPKDVAAAVKLIESYSKSSADAFRKKGRNELMAVSGVSAYAPPKGGGGEAESEIPQLSDADKEALMEIRNRK
jgi:hypothetical protein